MATESKLQRYVMQEIAKLGGTAEKFSSPARRGPPDLLVCWPANHWNGFHPQSNFGTIHTSRSQPFTEFIEMKAPGGRVTLLQQKDHERRRKMGFLVHVLGSEEQVEAYLKSRGKK